MKRSEAREQAFILIFERSFKDEDIDEIIEQAQISRSMVVDDYAYNLAQEVSGNLPWLDQIIALYSKKWKIKRISRVSLSILRLSLWEIDHVDTVPEGVSINEAVELAKKYGNADDFAFVNGVLGAYVRAKGQESSENTEAENSEEQQESSVSLNIEES
ncbi:MAG: transcription antitermination factor NusB [Oscillospiraceae bacterium]|nr:transcription antitermination factor NusB [Oscillospiraceae bacterium]MCI9363553.1 transcription antitermination factor NusB [Oscillospiraceae bacterium]